MRGTPNQRIATSFDVTESAVRRHKAGHIPNTLVLAQHGDEVAAADDLLAEVQHLRARTLAILESAERGGELRVALAAVREARGNMELLLRMLIASSFARQQEELDRAETEENYAELLQLIDDAIEQGVQERLRGISAPSSTDRRLQDATET